LPTGGGLNRGGVQPASRHPSPARRGARDLFGRTHYLELGLQVWAVTAIAALAGSFGAFFHRVHLERVARAKPQGDGN
jgi:hypothetical protein